MSAATVTASQPEPAAVATPAPAATSAAFSVVLALSLCHFLNDTMQSMLSAIYPMLKANYALTFGQIGFLTFTFQFTASLLQPAIGAFTDKRPIGYALPVGMGFTFFGLVLLAVAGHYGLLLAAAALVGLGSAVFHPESSRIARLASGGKHGTAQSVFQLGGNFGTAAGPLLAAFIVVPGGQASVAWFCLAALLGMVVLTWVSRWYGQYRRAAAGRPALSTVLAHSRRRVIFTLVVLALLVFSKNIYMASFTSYYTFYVIHRFDVSVQDAQLLLFLFLGAAAVGTVAGGPIGDRIGTKAVIWVSILGVLPFTLMLPYADLFWTAVLTVIIGMVLSSAFPAIVVFAQEMVPGRVGLIAGLFFGFAFGMGGIAAAVLGQVADAKGIDFVYAVCSYLPFLGLLTVFLPRQKKAG
ncbi:Fosmidomycin resistance protein [Hoeflea olei]|uniref:Fosmidomycin resistance protein n=2 Tax=Hoeflea olei TaxID=1480615 RepID=A0A1C1YZT0_9HYPH|nr:MFS transporter [Hoeflea olei]OCW58906.1 Fosmidomycin resistance protein [Hoeflea olei]